MQWINPEDAITIKQNAMQTGEQQVWDLINDLGEHFDEHKDMSTFASKDLVSARGIADALLVCSSHFTESQAFFESLSWTQRVIVSEQLSRVLKAQAEFASEADHTGEADE